MAKLDTIAQYHNLKPNEAMSRLIDGYFSNPHTEVGKHVSQVLAGAEQAQLDASTQGGLIGMYKQLPPDIQKAIEAWLMSRLTGGSEAATGF